VVDLTLHLRRCNIFWLANPAAQPTYLTNTIAASAAPHDFRLPSTAFSHRSGATVQVDTSVCCASPPSSAPSFGRLLAMPQSPAVPTGAACLPVVRASASTFGADEQNQVHADGMR